MRIPDDVIIRYLDTLLGHSKPGQTIHHMLLAATEPGSRTALGLPDPDRLKTTMFAIAPAGPEGVDEFISRTILAGIAEMHQRQAVIHFAGLAMEGWVVRGDGDEVTENRARRLHADRRLHEHAAAVEETRLYAASRDGRRWTGRHVLTGPQAGTVTGPTLHSSKLAEPEPGAPPWAHFILLAVGQVGSKAR